MSNVDIDDAEEERRRQQAAAPYTGGTASPAGSSGNPRDDMIARDRASWEAQLRQAGGSLYDPTDLEGVIRQVSYAQNAGQDPAKYIDEARQRYAERNRPTASAGGSGGDLDRNGDGRIDAGWTQVSNIGGGQWSNLPVNDPRVGAAPGGAAGGGTSFPSNIQATQHNVFSDPLTQQYERMLQQQMAVYQQQQQAMQQAAQAAEQRRAQTAAEVDRLTKFANERISKLTGPAYTGSEAEVLRTQLLDPLERDRTAAQQRALQQIGARGMDPSSGIAQQLLQDVNRAFDQERTRQQGGVAQRQIEEQRSREQEAQQLLQYLAMLPDAVARGDLDFVSYVQGLINQPGQQGLGVSQLLADLPGQRLQEALATLGIAPNIGGAQSNLLQMLQSQQAQRQLQQQNQANYWLQIGRSFGA